MAGKGPTERRGPWEWQAPLLSMLIANRPVREGPTQFVPERMRRSHS